MKPRRILNQPALITQSFALTAAALLLGNAAQAADGTWNNTAGGTWSTVGNWSGGTVAGGADYTADFSTINLTAPTTVSLDAPMTVGNLVFGDTTPTADPNNGNGSNGAPYGSSTTITGGWVLNNNSTPANILTLDVSTGQPTITVNNLGTYYSGYAVVSKSLTISAAIAGTNGLTKNGVAKLTLSGANTFSGGLNVTEGILALTGTQGFSGGISVSGSTSRLEFTDDINLGNTTSYSGSPPPSTIVNNLSLSGGATLFRNGDSGNVGKDTTLNLGTGGGTISYGGYSFLKFGFNLTGDGAFTLNAGNKGIILNGNNSAHTGGFNINVGNLFFSNAASLPTVGSILVGANGALDGGGAYSTVQAWLGSNRITASSTGQIALVNTGGGGTATSNTETINMTGYDSLFLGASTAVDLGSGNILRFYGTITPAGNTYRLSGSRGATLGMGNANILTGANNLIVGNGTFGGAAVNLYASNDFTGTTTVASNNTVNVYASNALGSGAISMLGSSSLRLSGGVTLGNTLTLNGTPGDAAVGALHSNSGANTWTGDITLGANSRIVTANATGSLALGNIALSNRALEFIAGGGTGGNITVSGAFSGTGNITKTNTAGTLTFTGDNTYGSTTISGGTLKIGNGGTTGSLGSGNVSIASTNNGRLVFDRSNSYAVGNAISGAGAVVQQGSGTVTLSNTNTYTGTTTGSAGTLLTTKAAALPGYSTSGKILFSGGTIGVQVGGSGWTTTQVDTLLTNATKTNGALGIDTTNGNLTQWTSFTTTNLGSTLGLSKLGNNTLTLDQTNSYTGATTVSAGTLLVNGSLGSSSAVTVNGGTLGGTGTVGGITTIASGGTFAPGNSIGTMDFSQTLTLVGISNFEIDPTLGLGLNADLANVTGGITYGGTLNVLYGGPATNFTNGMLFNLFDAASFTDTFDVVNLPTLSGGLSWQNDLALNGTISVVPEPDVVVLIGSLGMLGLLRRRKR